MASTQALQNLQEEFRKVIEQSKTTQNGLQQLRQAKKETDIHKKRQDVLSTLRSMDKSMAQLQEQMKDSERQLERALGEDGEPENKEVEQKEKENAKTKPIGLVEARNLTPEQQESLYELKASRMGTLKSQNKALKSELHLQQQSRQMSEARHAQKQSYSGSETLRAAHALEAKLRGANLKIKGLEQELRKSQQMTLKYKELYEDGQRQSENDSARDSTAKQSAGQERSKSAPKPKPAPLEQQSFIGPNTNVNDIVRKNECLLEENEIQRREIQRLKHDNARLLLQAKSASTDKHVVLARLGTSESARQDLHKRHEKLKKQNSQLSRSYTRQTSDWVEMKRQTTYGDDRDIWRKLYPVAPHGGRDRWFEHRTKRNTDNPRQMYPVENYGGTSTA